MTFSSPAKISAVQQKAQRRFYLFIENCRRNISLRQTLNSYSLCFIGSVNVGIIANKKHIGKSQFKLNRLEKGFVRNTQETDCSSKYFYHSMQLLTESNLDTVFLLFNSTF